MAKHTFQSVVLGLGLAAVLVQACSSSEENRFSDGTGGATFGSGGAVSIASGGQVVAASGGSTPAGSGGASSGCRVDFCPAVGSGTACCLTNGLCGVDFGMGCVRTPNDAGAGSGGRSGSGGGTSSGGVGGTNSGGAGDQDSGSADASLD